MINTPYIVWVATAALIAAACGALWRLRPGAALAPCQTPLLLCSLGMSIGLAVDVHEGRLALLDALCRSGTRSPLYWIGIHWQQLPAMHIGMLAGSLLVLTHHTSVRNLACGIFMTAGMCLGGLVHGPLAMLASVAGGTGLGSIVSMSIMLACMLIGMVFGHAAASICIRRIELLRGRAPDWRLSEMPRESPPV